MKALITADPIEALQLEMDTSILISSALRERGIEVDWCVLADQELSNSRYLSELRVRSIARVAQDGVRLVPEFSAYKKTSVDEYAVIFHRKDPPIDDFYHSHHEKFLDVTSKILQVNHPRVTLKYAEHELPQLFPEFGIPTLTIKSFSELSSFCENAKFKVVVKPHNSSSGNGILFIFSEADLLKYKTQVESGFPWVAQPFVPNIEKMGDLRVLYFNGKHLGQILRMPAPGSLLANIHQGGSVVAANLTPTQAKASQVVADKLLSMGAAFIGIDFLGDRISEVNITSPMGLRELNRLYGVASHLTLVDELKRILLH